MVSAPHTGSCLCGGVRFEIAGELPPIQVCHCAQCRKAQGSAFAAVLPVKLEQIRFNGGRELLREYESTPGKLRAFCSTCGSPVYSRRPDTPDVLRIRAGLVDNPVSSRIAAHAYVASKADWFEISDGLPQFPAGRPAP